MDTLRGVPAKRVRGFVSLWVFFLVLALMAMLGMAVDLAYLMLVGQQAQNAADASALAGAWALRESQLAGASQSGQTQRVIAYAQANGQANRITGQSVDLSGSSQITLGRFARSTSVFTPDATPFNAVRVTVQRTGGSVDGPVTLMFGRLVAIPTSELTRQAVGMVDAIAAGVVVLNRTLPGSLSLGGTGSRPKILVNLVNSSGAPTGSYGDVVVNSTDTEGTSWSGRPLLDVGNLWLGSNQTDASVLLPPGGQVYTQRDAVSDPLAGLYSGIPAKPTQNVTKANASGVWLAGYHPSGLPAGAVLGPGLHYIDGGLAGGVDASSGALVFVHSGDVDLGGNKQLILRRSAGTNDPNGYNYAPWAGLGITLWIYQGNVTMKGTPDIDNNGILYLTGHAPSGGHLELRGTPTSVGSQLICDTMSLIGNAECLVNYPGGPTLPTRTFLAR